MIYSWAIGVTFSLVAGHFGTEWFLRWLHNHLDGGDDAEYDRKYNIRVAPWITGMVERAFFVIGVGVNLPGIGTAMLG